LSKKSGNFCGVSLYGLEILPKNSGIILLKKYIYHIGWDPQPM